jgi:hypothetical protein
MMASQFLRTTTAPIRAEHRNHMWSYGIVHDDTTDGKRLKCPTVLDYARLYSSRPTTQTTGGTLRRTRRS